MRTAAVSGRSTLPSQSWHFLLENFLRISVHDCHDGQVPQAEELGQSLSCPCPVPTRENKREPSSCKTSYLSCGPRGLEPTRKPFILTQFSRHTATPLSPLNWSRCLTYLTVGLAGDFIGVAQNLQLHVCLKYSASETEEQSSKSVTFRRHWPDPPGRPQGLSHPAQPGRGVVQGRSGATKTQE